MKKFFNRDFWHWTARIILGGVFFLAGLLKLLDLGSFQGVIEQYEVMPFMTPIIVFGLPWLEVASGIALLLPRNRGGAWFLMTFLLATFLGFNTWQWYLGNPANCGCFGDWDVLGQTHAGLLVRNGMLLFLAFLARPMGRELEAPAISGDTSSPS